MEHSLSRRAFVQFKKLIEQEGLRFTDEESHEMSSRLLSLASAIGNTGNEPEGLNLMTQREGEALAVIQDYFRTHSRFPSARELSRLLRYRSSRTGHDLLNRLRIKGLLDEFRHPVAVPIETKTAV